MPMPKGTLQRGALGRILGAKGLTAQQECYVITYVRNGGDAEAAAREAGYSVPKQSVIDLNRSVAVQVAIKAALTGSLERCMAKSLHLLERRLEQLARSDEDIDLDAMRKLIGTLAARVLPTPKPLEDNDKSLDDASIDDLETALASLKRQRSDAALMLEGSAQVIEPQGE